MSTENIDRAAKTSAEWINKIGSAIDADEALRPIIDAGCGWAAVGSVGRREVVQGSDVDLILLRPACALGVSSDDLSNADRRARDVVQVALGVKVSRGADPRRTSRETRPRLNA